jgi:hypothetical protein
MNLSVSFYNKMISESESDALIPPTVKQHHFIALAVRIWLSLIVSIFFGIILYNVCAQNVVIVQLNSVYKSVAVTTLNNSCYGLETYNCEGVWDCTQATCNYNNKLYTMITFLLPNCQVYLDDDLQQIMHNVYFAAAFYMGIISWTIHGLLAICVLVPVFQQNARSYRWIPFASGIVMVSAKSLIITAFPITLAGTQQLLEGIPTQYVIPSNNIQILLGCLYIIESLWTIVKCGCIKF